LKKKILIISQYFPPDISGGGTRAFNYAKCLSQQNFEVTVISAFPHLHANVPKKFRFKLLHKEKMDGFELIRVRVPSLLHTSARNRIILHLSFLISSMIPIFSIKPDVIFASEPNLFSIIPAFFYSKLHGGPVIRIVDDLWPEAIYERGYVKSRLLKKFLDKLAKFSYTYAKFILPLTETGKQIIHNSYNIVNDKIIVLGHGVDTNIFTHTEQTKKSDFILMYSGSFVESYDFDLIINAAKKLQDENIKFVLRGKGTLLSYLQNEKKNQDLKNLLIDTEIVPLEYIAKKLAYADVFIVPMKNEIALNSTLPTKILEYQATGRPIICCSDGAPGKYVEKTKSGIKTKYENLDEFIDAIQKLKSEPQLCKELGQNGKKYVNENLTFDKIGKTLSRYVEESMQK
jgi:glycosyltransferase involved in cell wall biosynthesis